MNKEVGYSDFKILILISELAIPERISKDCFNFTDYFLILIFKILYECGKMLISFHLFGSAGNLSDLFVKT